MTLPLKWTLKGQMGGTEQGQMGGTEQALQAADAFVSTDMFQDNDLLLEQAATKTSGHHPHCFTQLGYAYSHVCSSTLPSLT